MYDCVIEKQVLELIKSKAGVYNFALGTIIFQIVEKVRDWQLENSCKKAMAMKEEIKN